MADVIVLAVVEDQIDKYERSIARKINYLKELEDDRISLAAVLAKEEAGDVLGPDFPYESYADWIGQLEDEIKASDNAISRIEIEEKLLVALKYYVATAATPEAQ